MLARVEVEEIFIRLYGDSIRRTSASDDIGSLEKHIFAQLIEIERLRGHIAGIIIIAENSLHENKLEYLLENKTGEVETQKSEKT